MAEVNRTKFSYRHHSFMVFIDGVEVPWLFIQIKTTFGSPTVVEVYVEPDDLIESIRPKSYIHIFMSDPYNEDAPKEGRPDKEYDRNSKFDKDRYYLCFEGEVQGITESESAESRSMVIACSDLFGIINNTSLDLVQLNNGIHVPLINGSTFYGSFTAPPGDSSVLNFVLYAAMGFSSPDPASPDSVTSTLESQVAKTEDQQFPLLRDGRQGSDQFFYFDAVRLAMKYFMQFNASYRLQAMRTRMFDKMFGIADQTFQRFMERRVAQTLIQEGFENVPYTSLGELMMYALGVGLHNYTSMLFPVPNQKQTEGAWNQYLFMPNMYYAIPPSCNWIFPEHVQSLNASRFFMQEPTRIGVRDPMVGQFGLMHVAPMGLSDLLTGGSPPTAPADQTRLSPEIFMASNPSVSVRPRGERELDGITFKLSDDAENKVSNPNLLRLLSSIEIEKGVVFRISDISVEYFAGIHGATDVIDGDSAFRQKEPVGDKLDNEIRSMVRDQSDYIKYAQTITEYRLSLEQLNRDVSLAGPFNPWAVAGFPAMVCRQDRSYRGLLVGLNHTIGASGEAQTVYQLAYTTLFHPKLGGLENLNTDIRDVTNQTRKAKRAAETAQKKADAVKANLPEQIWETDPQGVATQAKKQIEDLGTISDAIRTLRADTKSWRKDADLVGFDRALQTFNSNLPERTRSRISKDMNEVMSLAGQLSSIVRDTRHLFVPAAETANPLPYSGFLGGYDEIHATEMGTALNPSSSALKYTPRMDSYFQLVDHIFDFPSIAAGAPTGTTTAGVTTAPNYANPPVGSAEVLSASQYRSLYEGRNFTVLYNRSGATTKTGAFKDLITGTLGSVDVIRSRVLAALGGARSIIAGSSRFEERGFVFVFIGRLKSVDSDGNVSEQETQTRWSITKLEELLDGLVERAIRLASGADGASGLDALSSALQGQVDFLLKDQSSAEYEAWKSRKDLQSLTKSVESVVESAPIMPFANPKLLDPSAVEGEYEAVLGESDTLSSLVPQTLSKAFLQASDLDARLLQGVAAESFFRLASNIFNFDSTSERQTLYDNWQSSGDVPREVNKFTRRKDALTLREFLSRTDLTLYEETARFGPFTRTFYRMGASQGSLGSYFDKLLENNHKIIGETNADRDIQLIRESVHPESKDPLLYEEARQEIILRYAQRHFVPRALRGK